MQLIIVNVSEVRKLELAFPLPASAVMERTVCHCLLAPSSHHSLLSAFPLPTSVISIARGLASHSAQHERLPCSSVQSCRQEHHYPIVTHHHYQSPGK